MIEVEIEQPEEIRIYPVIMKNIRNGDIFLMIAKECGILLQHNSSAAYKTHESINNIDPSEMSVFNASITIKNI